MAPKKPKKNKKGKSKSLEQLTVKQADIGPTVLLESSFILALLDPRDSNYKAVKSVFGFLEPHNCRFHIPVYVFAEVVSKIIHKTRTVSNALKTFEKFIDELHGVPFVGSNPSLEEIIKRYKGLARKQIRFLQSNDFFIATEGILSKSLILTCDLGMYEKVKRNYQDIYFVATDSRKYKDDIPRFTRKLLAKAPKKKK
ncbi:hypothetical protein A2766_03955 [Candidatus Kaiserbacteria bacterium RIFCSPHIGHO2_01_FULL_58_22]|uniref:PIN domain-containing protein n=1 Tax=Candidatus Kaiserbacteria bacterium GW2011_GWA2_58_9 TaxID=1618672 RepID=A0A0G2B065_9BACT|nr:MAG: hypothetical protein UY98_C0016G0004 [Candidatus Kaiserbacteria bacterium GW2011_GWA2_58_9]OGG63184.1 MAG: hypothetical protein A2766_03955 [Candidatus Kaiserbacteria bacterium RIFCSPHIGHO2_01_FULL_58_22]